MLVFIAQIRYSIYLCLFYFCTGGENQITSKDLLCLLTEAHKQQAATLTKISQAQTKQADILSRMADTVGKIAIAVTNTSISKINNSDYQLQLPVTSWEDVIILDKNLKEHSSIRIELVSLKYP